MQESEAYGPEEERMGSSEAVGQSEQQLGIAKDGESRMGEMMASDERQAIEYEHYGRREAIMALQHQRQT